MLARRSLGSSSQCGGALRGFVSGRASTSRVGRPRKLSCPRVRDDHRSCVLEHVSHQGIWQRGVEKQDRPARLENPQVGGHDLPVVLRHGHADDLVRAGEKGRQRRSHGLGARVELGEGQGFPGVGDLQGREIGESRGGAAEDLRQPLHSLLVRDVPGVPAAEDIRQAVRAGVLLLEPALAGHPEVPPPRHERQTQEEHEGGCQDGACHDSTSDSRERLARRCLSRSIAPAFLCGGCPGSRNGIRRPASSSAGA